LARKRIGNAQGRGKRVRGNKELILVDLFDPKTGETFIRKFKVDVHTYCDENKQSEEYRTICAEVIDEITGMEMSVIKKPKGAKG